MLNLPQNPKWDIARVSHSTLVNADCFDVFPFIEDKSIDAIICDLPYGTTACKWDVVIPFEPLWEQYKRIIKDRGAIVLFGSQPFTSTLVMSNLKMFKYEWIWEKDKPNNFALANKQPMKYHENILVFYEKQPTFNKQLEPRKGGGKSRFKYPVDNSKRKSEHNNIQDDVKMFNPDLKNPSSIQFISTGRRQDLIHPTQKPVKLMEYLIRTYTNEGDMVLDNTMGSGTTNLAALKLNRKSIGIEKEKQYYDVAVRRLSEYCG